MASVTRPVGAPPTPAAQEPGAQRRGLARAGLAEILVVMAVGVLLVSLADAAGRRGSAGPGWVAVFWLGELAVFTPVVVRLVLRRPLRGGEAITLVVSLALAAYLIKYLYSPVQFGFPDELEHLRTTTNILTQGRLFTANYLLPVSPRYPGLELVTAALVSVSGLSVFVAGLIVAGLSHVLFVVSIYLILRAIRATPRLAGLACAIYATGPHFQVFDAIFGYQTLALLFFGATLLAMRRLTDVATGGRARWWALVIAAGTATIVTHHLTSYALVGTLALIGAVELAHRARTRHGLRAWWPPPCALTGAAVLGVLTVSWLLLIAPVTLGYLRPALTKVLGGFSGGGAGSGTAPAGPLQDTLSSYAAAGLIMLILPIGYWCIWRARQRDTWAVAMGIGSLGYYLVVLLRLVSAGGAELAGRSTTFLYFPVGYVLATATVAMVTRRPLRHARRGRHEARRPRRLPNRALRPVAVLGALVLFGGGIAAGWPPYWERLPGGYVVDGFESGITPEGLAVARWAKSTLGPGKRLAADFTNYVLLGSYGDQDVVAQVSTLYYGRRFSAQDAALLRHLQIGYVVVDLRLSRHMPSPEGYFPGPASSCPCPIPRTDLLKFGRVPGVDLIYDSGNILVFDVRGAHRAP